MPYTVPNQRVVTIHREKARSDFLGIKNENWQSAARDLGAHALLLYLYLASNADGYDLALSPAAIRQAVGMARSTYHDQFARLIDKGYLVETGGSTYDFYEVPQTRPGTPLKKAVSADGLNSEECPSAVTDREPAVHSIPGEDIEINNTTIGRPHDFEELRLLAECVRASKFISKSQEEHLLTTIEDLCSESQIEELHNEVYLVGRNKTSNRHIMRSMEKINRAIKAKCKISFKYLKYTLNDRSTQVARRGGKDYIRSPYKLIINDGNYYLLAYDSEKESMMTYRLDRMQGVEIVKQPRDGAAAYDKIDMRTYTQRVFSMFGGEDKFVSIRFTNDLLDTAVERFGNGEEVFYRPDGKGHFVVSAHVEISKQFYAWVCGFYNKAKIINPPEVVEGMKEFLHGIADRYESE